MPNTLTTIFTSTPSTEPVEAPHPNTGVYTTGTQLANGTWQVIHAGVTKTATPPTITGRLKNYPTVGASIVASGNVLNNVLAVAGASAAGTSATAVNATVSSATGVSAYRLFGAATQAGTYTQLYQGAAASFAHTGLSASTAYWYKWQYVGGGFYDDSVVGAAFSGTTTVAGAYPAQAIRLAVAGPSLYCGVGSSGGSATGFFAQARPQLDPAHYTSFTEVAVNGATTSFFEASRSYYQSQIGSLTPTPGLVNLLLIGPDINDAGLTPANTAAQDYAVTLRAHKQAQANGWYTLAATNTKQGGPTVHYPGISNVDLQTKLDAYDALVRAGYASDFGALGLLDAAQIAGLQTPTASPPFDGGGLHLHADGYALMATAYKALVEQVVRSPLPADPNPLSAPWPGALRNFRAADYVSGSWPSASSGTPTAGLFSGTAPVAGPLLNGLPTVRFAGGKLRESANLGLSGTAARTVTLVVQQVGSGNANVLGWGGATGGAIFDVLFLSGTAALHIYGNDTSGKFVASEVPPAAWAVVQVSYDGYACTVRIGDTHVYTTYPTSAAVSPFATLATVNGPLLLGAGAFSGLDGLNANVAEILLRDDAAPVRMQHDFAYLKAKYAL